ncbi:BQ5605_C011g06479 [Microbotryum silenes-dioicae]|uniref:BQ5605_C011g06479 protein n=1 Tax=Microbotryum silenes-dioicae TaxID=796604 RepID=A0A2X0NT28_9BASI|nr:BQ5605_C011g06479 [Microbotryum silenes-dioicae]
MSLKRGNLIFSGLGLFCLPLDILFLSRASQNVLIALRSARMRVRIAGISVTNMFLLRFRAQFEFEIVELLRTAHLLFVCDHIFSLFICGFIEVSLEIVFVAVFVRLRRILDSYHRRYRHRPPWGSRDRLLPAKDVPEGQNGD